MPVTAFLEACERWDAIAGPADWEAFADAADRLIASLRPDDQDVVGRIIDVLRSRDARETPRSRRLLAADRRPKVESV